MQQHIKQRWDGTKLETIAQYFGIRAKSLTILDGFESFIYEYKRDGKGYILRVAHSDRRSRNLIQGEVDWINFLANGGAQVAKAIQSDNDKLVEALDDGQGAEFLATAFVKAAGDHLPHNDWTPEFIQHYGETMGRIHRLSKDYAPPHPEWKRLHWNDPTNINLESWASVLDKPIMDKLRKLLERLQSLPQDATYHMIHQDAHGGNFYVDDKGQITLFDFDDCCYGHEIYDIAMIFFYGPVRDDPQGAEKLTRNFFIGYQREHQMDVKWLAHIKDFMLLREIDLYAMIERDIDWRNGEDPWAARFMQNRRERLLNDVPFVDFDFTSVADIFA